MGGCCPSILNLHTVEVFAHSDQLITKIISSSWAREGAKIQVLGFPS